MCVYIYIRVRGLTCVLHVVVLQKKNTLLLEYAGKGVSGGVLMALQVGANVNHKNKVYTCSICAYAYSVHVMVYTSSVVCVYVSE